MSKSPRAGEMHACGKEMYDAAQHTHTTAANILERERERLVWLGAQKWPGVRIRGREESHIQIMVLAIMCGV